MLISQSNRFLDCRTLQNPRNGHVLLINGTTFGANATYSCNSRFQLDDDNRRQCLPNGVWSGDEPKCTSPGMYIKVFVSFFDCYAPEGWHIVIDSSVRPSVSQSVCLSVRPSVPFCLEHNFKTIQGINMKRHRYM